MRTTKLIAPLLILCLGLGGCHVSGEVENLAYVLALGIDRLGDGRLELTARVPRVGKSAGAKGNEDAQSPYLVFHAAGDGLPGALEALQLATPRQLNLSHIEMVAVSEALAREADFPALVDRLVETPHLYATAPLIVCGGTARAFIESLQTVIGARLSGEIKAMLKHYADQGCIPETTLAGVSYANRSIYSDPVAIWAELSEGAQAPESPLAQRYAGAALFKNGRLVRVLDVDKTRLLTLIQGSARSIDVNYDGRPHELTTERAPAKYVQIEGDRVAVKIELAFTTVDELSQEDASRAENALEGEIKALVESCRRDGAEPFGFAERAVSGFASIPEWQAFRWRERFSTADVEISVRIHTSG